MSGHNKWSTIKHRKGAQDAKRGRAFTKISKELTVAARIGGGDPAANPRLRLAIQQARAASMTSDTVTRAIKKGTGDLEGSQVLELTYEGYGPGGVAMIVECVSDNTNRTSGEIRNMLEKSGGNLAKSGAVSFIFTRRGMVRYDAAKFSEDQVMEAALDAGADDVVSEGEHVVVYTEPNKFHAVKEALDAKGLESMVAELTMIPSNTVSITDGEIAKKVLKLYERLEDHEDVQNVYANFDIPEELMASAGE
jgi:YebC/PmpR family DNA-binding regulatory protein